jgi:hypothetical protein
MKFNPDKSLNEQAVSIRIEIGIDKENEIRCCLNKYYKFNLVPSTSTDDRIHKTDCYFDGKKDCPVAIKGRFSGGNDILVALRDPWHGFDDPRTKIGRDIVKPYKLYICLSKDHTIIRVIKGSRIYEICEDMLGELANREWKISRDNPMFSEKHEGCQIRCFPDAYTKQSKLAGFIPQSYFKRNEIRCYDFVKD